MTKMQAEKVHLSRTIKTLRLSGLCKAAIVPRLPMCSITGTGIFRNTEESHVPPTGTGLGQGGGMDDS